MCGRTKSRVVCPQRIQSAAIILICKTFREIRGTNTESVEQGNGKHMCNRMAEFKFKELIWFVIETRDELMEERLQSN